MLARRALASLIIASIFTFPAAPLLAEDAPEPEAPEAAERTVAITIRDGADILWSGEASVPDSDSATTTVTATDGTLAEALAASALAALIAADAAAPEFEITNLQYFSSFGSFYLKCITAASEKCDNWQYAVGDTYPSVGMDQYILHDSDDLFIYFGSPRRTTLSTSTILIGESVTVTAESYVPASDAYTPAAGVTLGVTQDNPDDPYTPFVIATSTADAAGQAMFTLSATGTYAVGIAEDYFYPSAALTVIEAPAEEPEPEEPPPAEAPRQSGGGGGGSSAPAHIKVNVSAAISFLSLNQNPDGSFATPLLTDWAALAFAATPEYESEEMILRRYLTEHNDNLTSLTDYERHTMALLALGVNPYTDAGTDYIAKILSYFDGVQFGDAALVNDDIFALIPLVRTGYGVDDAAIAATSAFIISKQKPDGSWDSVDLTAAAIQALTPVNSLPGAGDAIARASAFLHAKQESNGSIGNSFSTSWTLQAIHALGGDMAQWQPGGKNPEDYLASLQSSDGGIESPASDIRTRIWATEYVIPAALGKPLPLILREFPRPILEPESPAPRGASATSPVITLIPATTTPPATTPENESEDAADVVVTPVLETPVMRIAESVQAADVEDATSDVTDDGFTKPVMWVPAITQSAAAAAAAPNLFLRIVRWLENLFASLRALVL
ncbi:hypothetical protein A3A38_00640 [Candidatus Kaiserbacteria bacterium RIFCSPLOWO2_01_FULL_53_17]|uniref:DUF4430 domain-containing protein n=1 Tax=Candidatus Kaiserbacteria bacterium RIFCSPLOWO2_01_FULL_53_17 TaxID=1798511 RepID=A0A1F6EGQ0_9BACT|nr:MAG: hypothetical protein A3A38_00640 [Candidatus Kaiserbacteria bacterium RIFCSPLOWO2_01_FULL_53_17]